MRNRYSIKDVADIFGISYQQVVNHCKSAGVPIMMCGDGYHKYIESKDLMKLKSYEELYNDHIRKGGSKRRWRGRKVGIVDASEIELARKELGL